MALILAVVTPLAPATGAALSASISVKLSVHGAVAVSFNSAISGGVKPYSYRWDFDAADGWQTEKIVKDPSWVYPGPGQHEVTLKVTDSRGATITTTRQVTVETLAYSWKDSAPITLNNVHGTADNPIRISGLEIADSVGDSIHVVHSSHVIIEGNYIHGARVASDELSNGNAIYVQDSNDIEIGYNILKNNNSGVWVNATPDSPRITNVSMHDNVVVNSRSDHGLMTSAAIGVSAYNNVLRNNGDKSIFDLHRITGIEVWDSDNVVLHDNFSSGSSSDGFGVASSNERRAAEPGFACKNVTIYRNNSIGNGEQGIWLSYIHGGSAHDNYTFNNHNDDPALGSSGIRLEGDVSNFEVSRNRLVKDEVAGIGIQLSRNVAVFDNFIENPLHVGILVDSKQSSGLAGVPISGVVIHNNIVSGAIFGILLKGGTGTRVINNTIYNTSSDGINNDLLARNSIIANNIIYRSHGSHLYNIGTKALLLRNLVETDPKFRAENLADFDLRTDSPAMGAGTPKYTYCKLRPNGRPDLGAICTRR